jgi:hypothetical protein
MQHHLEETHLQALLICWDYVLFHPNWEMKLGNLIPVILFSTYRYSSMYVILNM